MGEKILFGQYKNNRSLWKVPTIHRNLTCVCVCVYLRVCVCVCMSIYECVCMSIYECVCVYLFMPHCVTGNLCPHEGKNYKK